MFIELVDALRCPVPHEESWLVAASTRMAFRHIVEGTLGCPVCKAQYPVHRGVVDFRRATHAPLPPDAPPDDAQATRLAALLDLTDHTGFAVLLGRWSVHAPLVRAIAETPLLIVDPPDGMEGEPGISVIRCDGLLPLAAGASRGTAIDGGDEARVASAVRATRAKGRLVAPVTVALPDGATELARDESVWVAEREAAASALVTLHVRRGS
jgi:uncharacterized protein YbaR (Trm112 family)